MKFPKHIALTIDHNPHATSYISAEQYLQNCAYGCGEDDVRDDEFATPECRQQIAATNELWEATWYPDTPVGHCTVYASSLERLLAALEVKP